MRVTYPKLGLSLSIKILLVLLLRMLDILAMLKFGYVKDRFVICNYEILFLDARNTPDFFAHFLDFKGLTLGHQLV
jgi:hypothetical protein